MPSIRLADGKTFNHESTKNTKESTKRSLRNIFLFFVPSWLKLLAFLQLRVWVGDEQSRQLPKKKQEIPLFLASIVHLRPNPAEAPRAAPYLAAFTTRQGGCNTRSGLPVGGKLEVHRAEQAVEPIEIENPIRGHCTLKGYIATRRLLQVVALPQSSACNFVRLQHFVLAGSLA